MSKGNPQAGGSTSGFGSQGQFGAGYTQPYGAPSSSTYDPMLGVGQSSGMGTTFNYPTRYSADYTRYAQSGQPFNQPVMGYNTYGQIFAQPQRPPPTMGGKGGSKFQPQPPSMGGKGGGGFQPGYGYQPQFPNMMTGGPGFQQINRRGPERRSNQLGLNQPPKDTGVPGSFLDFYSRQNNPANPYEAYPIAQVPQTGGPGATPPPLTGGVPTDFNDGLDAAPPQLISDSWSRRRLNPDDFQPLVQPGPTDPSKQMNYALGRFDSNAPKPMPVSNGPILSYPGGSRNWQQQFEGRSSYYNGSGPAIEPAPVEANRQIIDENIYNSPFNLLVGQTAPRKPQVMFDNQAFQDFNFGQGFGRMAFQEGGQVPPDANMEMMMAETAQPEMAGEYDRLIQMTMQAILGQVESPDEVIQMFIDEFGVDAFRQLREAVLKQQVPNAQTEGMVDGNGGGMDDQVMGMIGNQRPVAVSPGEYIVPADVVSGLGDGSSKSGADILDELNRAVRMARTGTTQQPRPLMETMQ